MADKIECDGVIQRIERPRQSQDLVMMSKATFGAHLMAGGLKAGRKPARYPNPKATKPDEPQLVM
jgi:hypothetical protein